MLVIREILALNPKLHINFKLPEIIFSIIEIEMRSRFDIDTKGSLSVWGQVVKIDCSNLKPRRIKKSKAKKTVLNRT